MGSEINNTSIVNFSAFSDIKSSKISVKSNIIDRMDFLGNFQMKASTYSLKSYWVRFKTSCVRDSSVILLADF